MNTSETITADNGEIEVKVTIACCQQISNYQQRVC